MREIFNTGATWEHGDWHLCAFLLSLYCSCRISHLLFSWGPVVNSPPTVAYAVKQKQLRWGNRLVSDGGRGMGLALMGLIWLITLISTYFFVAKTWWLPAGAAEAAHFIDGQLALTFVLMGIVFLAAQLSLGYIVWKYREQPSSPPVLYSHGNTRLEIVWTVLTTILFVGLNLMGSSVWASQRFDQAGPGAVQVEVTGMQFAWYFRYPGPDGKYGATSAKLMDPSAGGEAAVGLNTSDPAAKDDVVTGTMFLPVDREVDLSLRAVDVIHSFFVPSLRFKQDAVPGLNIHMHFKPTAIGEYEIACAELCGLGHYKMHGMVHVVSQEDFDKWLSAREAEKQ